MGPMESRSVRVGRSGAMLVSGFDHRGSWSRDFARLGARLFIGRLAGLIFKQLQIWLVGEQAVASAPGPLGQEPDVAKLVDKGVCRGRAYPLGLCGGAPPFP